MGGATAASAARRSSREVARRNNSNASSTHHDLNNSTTSNTRRVRSPSDPKLNSSMNSVKRRSGTQSPLNSSFVGSQSSDDFFREIPQSGGGRRSIPNSIVKGYTQQPSGLGSHHPDSFGEEGVVGAAVGEQQEVGEELSSFQLLRQRCGQIVDDERAQMFILILIAINSIMFGVATFPSVKNDVNVMSTFEKVDIVILVIFTIESLLQITYNGVKRFFKDGWLVFDLTIVAISWASVEVYELRSLRVFRAFRFVTQVSILRNVVVALFSIVPAIMSIFTLLLLIFYIFAVMYTQLFKYYYAEGYTDQDYFGRLDYTFFTLFQFLCLDEWSGIAYEVVAVSYWAWAIFIAFIIMSAFVVVNLLIAVICDALQILRTAEAAVVQKMHGSYMEEEDEGFEMDDNGMILEGSEGEQQSDGGAAEEILSRERIQLRVKQMEHMLDEMVVSQETMARTIDYLSLALSADRKSDSLTSINEINNSGIGVSESSREGSLEQQLGVGQ